MQFTDKSNNRHTLDRPEAYLSPRSIDRRQRQHIALDSSDLPLPATYIDTVRALGLQIHNRSKWLNAVTIRSDDPKKLAELKGLSMVRNIQKVAQWKIDTTRELKSVPYRNHFSRDIVYEYGPAYQQIRMIGGDVIHDMGYRGEGMLIAVMDAGFSGLDELNAFENLRNEGRIVAEADFVNNTSNVYQYSRHGTYVMSIMAAEVPGLMVGTAPRASYALLVTEDVSSELLVEEDNWVAAAEYADSIGADVSNTSLGYTTFDVDSMNHTYEDMDGNTTPITRAADMAAKKGMIVVNSAGNSGMSPWHYISAPADGDSVMAVGAVDNDSVVAPFSSYGPAADGDIKPNVAAVGWRTVTWSFEDDTIRLGNGTSYSSPIIAGMAACLWQAFPNKGNMDIFYAIQQHASHSEHPNDRLGYGIPSFPEAYFALSETDFEPAGGDMEVRAFPNPTDEHFDVFLRTTNDQEVLFRLYNAQGRLVWQKWFDAISNTNHIFPVDALQRNANGVYFLRIDPQAAIDSRGPSNVLRIIKSSP